MSRRRTRSHSRLSSMSDDEMAWEQEIDTENTSPEGDSTSIVGGSTSMLGSNTLKSPNGSNTSIMRNNENINTGKLKNKLARSPFTPLQNVVYNMRQRLELNLGEHNVSSCRTSPNLEKLRATPGSKLKERQAILLRKHKEAKDRSDSLHVGGGVSIWPEMDNMRLTKTETTTLTCTCITLAVAAVCTFNAIHGEVESRLQHYTKRLQQFFENQPLDMSHSNASFKSSVLRWHTAYTALMEEIETSFAVSLVDAPPSFQACVIAYVIGITTLLYYLADNILAHSNLTPRRIKVWVSLVVVMGVWTILVVKLLFWALQLENGVEAVIHRFSGHLGDLAYTELNLETYRDVLLHWRMCCLPPTTSGTLTVLGVVGVRDIMYYLQYYSFPVITALITPVAKLIWSLKEVYSTPVHT